MNAAYEMRAIEDIIASMVKLRDNQALIPCPEDPPCFCDLFDNAMPALQQIRMRFLLHIKLELDHLGSLETNKYTGTLSATLEAIKYQHEHEMAKLTDDDKKVLDKLVEEYHREGGAWYERRDR